MIPRGDSDAAPSIIEIVIWSVPRPVSPSEHGFKYRRVFVRDGQRVVCYDTERGKGDHRHLRDAEVSYRFRDVPVPRWTMDPAELCQMTLP
jgi:hypothetical protein